MCKKKFIMVLSVNITSFCELMKNKTYFWKCLDSWPIILGTNIYYRCLDASENGLFAANNFSIGNIEYG